MREYKIVEQDEEYSLNELREKYNEALDDIEYLEWQIKELDSDYEGVLYDFLELLDKLAVYEARYGELTESQAANS